MQRDRTVDRSEGAEPLIRVLDEQFVVEQPPPQRYRLAGQRRINLVADAVHLDTGIDADAPALRFAGEGAEPIPGAHCPQASFRQCGQPVLGARMRLRSVRLGVVADQIVAQPQIGFGLVLRHVEMIERLVRFLDRAERPLDLALRSRGYAPPIRATRHVRVHIDT